MKIFLWFLLIAPLSFSAQAEEELNCDHLHKGKYIMTGPAGGEIKIKRKKKVQIERYNRENQKYRWQIEWTSSCDYTLTLKKIKGKKSGSELVGAKVYVSIYNAHFDYYSAYSKKENGKSTHIEVTKLR